MISRQNTRKKKEVADKKKQCLQLSPRLNNYKVNSTVPTLGNSCEWSRCTNTHLQKCTYIVLFKLDQQVVKCVHKWYTHYLSFENLNIEIFFNLQNEENGCLRGTGFKYSLVNNLCKCIILDVLCE